MGPVEERNRKFYTEKGLEALRTRIRTLIRLYNEDDFPLKAHILGFGLLQIQTKEECLSRIKELSDLIGFKFKVNSEASEDGIKWNLVEVR